jgi:sugar lactone lactonase YvrE
MTQHRSLHRLRCLQPSLLHHFLSFVAFVALTALALLAVFTSPAAHAQTVTTYAGSGTAGFNNGVATSAQFNNPSGVCTDAAGNIYVADRENHRIRRIDGSGNVTTYAGTGTAGFNNGVATSAQFDFPSGVCADAAGNIYVADFGNNRIRRIDGSGNVTTYAGTGTAGFNNGVATSAQFSTPYGVCADAAGNIYVADFGNNRIRRIDGSGNVTTYAGTGTAGFNNGSATSAQFSNHWC